MQIINQLKQYHRTNHSIFAIRHVFRKLKAEYDTQRTNELIDAIELNEYWSRKGLFVNDSQETLSFLKALSDWLEHQLCLGTIKQETDKFKHTVTRTRTNLTLPEYEKTHIDMNYKPVFSGSKNTMLYLDIENFSSLYFDSGKVVERTAPDKLHFRFSVEMKVRTLKFQKYSTKHVFENSELLTLL